MHLDIPDDRLAGHGRHHVEDSADSTFNLSAKAKDYYQKLATLASSADTDRPDLVEAREYLAKN